MANTLTLDNASPEQTTLENLTPEEQDSLKLGEEIQSQEENLLAGKYKTAQELEKAYGELQKKLGEKSEPDSTESESEDEIVAEDSTEPSEVSPAIDLITSANDEYYQNDGKLSDETIEKFSSMSSKDLVNAYIEIQKNNPQAQQQVADISQASINEVKNFVGGEKSYDQIVDWAANTLDQPSIEAFDSIVNTGSVEAIKIAVQGLKAQYENANGFEGRMVTGKQAPAKVDTYRSQAELVAAMSDPRYDQDPSYRQDVIEKLGRSEQLQF